jgi:hypothetical protein
MTVRQREAAELRAQGLTMELVAIRMGVSRSRVRHLLDPAKYGPVEAERQRRRRAKARMSREATGGPR